MHYLYKYVTPKYVSNCMLEAIRAKLKDPRHVKLYFCKPTLAPDFQMFHFMWSDGEADYDFADDSGRGKTPWYKCVLVHGRIRRFRRGVAARYTAQRNRRCNHANRRANFDNRPH